MTCTLAVSDKRRLSCRVPESIQLKNEILDLESRVASSMTRMHMNDTPEYNSEKLSGRCSSYVSEAEPIYNGNMSSPAASNSAHKGFSPFTEQTSEEHL